MKPVIQAAPTTVTPAILSISSPSIPAVPEPITSINDQDFMTSDQTANSNSRTAAAGTPTLEGPTEKEQDRLEKIEKDLDKIEEVLKEMGFDLVATALSGAALDPIGAAFAASNSVITVPKLIYYYGNLQKHIFFLSTSKTTPGAKARLKELTSRLKKVSEVILKATKAPKALKEIVMQVMSSISNATAKKTK